MTYDKRYTMIILEEDWVKEWFHQDTYYKRVTQPDTYLDFDTEEEAIEEALRLDLHEFILVPAYKRNYY